MTTSTTCWGGHHPQCRSTACDCRCHRSGTAALDGVALIAIERRRQTEQEGYGADHDDRHGDCALISAALVYATTAAGRMTRQEAAPSLPALDWPWPMVWPWDEEDWRPSPTPVGDLVKAGALIAAEIDRLQRLEARQ